MKYGYYEYRDLPDSYKTKAICSICDNLKLTDKKTDFYGKTKYYCKNCRSYRKLDDSICQNCLISKENYNKLGSFTPSGCYITTIICDILGYPDDCEVLTTLRSFRDNYLKQHLEYLNILLEYDYLGPIISEKIKEEKNNNLLCNGLYNYFLIPCVDAIKSGLMEDAIEIYKNMVIQLHDDFNLPIINVTDKEYDLETLGKGRIRKPSTI